MNNTHHPDLSPSISIDALQQHLSREQAWLESVRTCLRRAGAGLAQPVS